MNWSGRCAGVLSVVVLVVTAAGCSAGNSGGAEGEASCAVEFTYQGRTYKDVVHADFTVTGKLGTATMPPCDDTGGDGETVEDGTTETAYGVEGVAPEVAIAVGSSPDDVVFVVSYSGSTLPPEVQKLIDAS
ncbi:DUF6281 family protein [Streptomyces sp. NPDC002908]|uniref:DUF6281 family protein n=1 Tax=Streptomyces sp. NPDC002908 TaxID=3364670 RepID=UPI0036A5F421